ncbi:MAG: ABC transporter ATP-binding protein [Bacilli bacterium]|nr:ABC transporter ATP-binding protein [Bacilli bacterium]
MKNITRTFGSLVANDNITLTFKKGEIHALLGENGAGKSTLMSILFGLIPPTSGQIFLNGKEVHVKDPTHANQLGIGMVHQHFMLVDCFTGLENIILGHEDTKLGFVRYREAVQKCNSLMNQYGLHVDLNKKISDMSVSMQQKVEILKMLYRDSNILIFDEPTAVLTEMEIEDLMKIILKLKSEGKTILFISHKLNEVKQISDRITILRKGKDIGTYLTTDLDNEQMAELMVGKHISFTTEKSEAKPTDTVLEIKHLSVKKADSRKLAVNDFSLQVRKGEIIAIAGIDGNGQDEIVEAITGLSKAKSGQILFNGEDITRSSIRQRNEKGVNHIPADRHRYGLVLDYNVMYNLILEQVHTSHFSHWGILKRKEIESYADTLIEKYDVRSSLGSYTLTRSMSGGNQQKVIVAREIERHGDLLLAVQPTRGLDVGAIENIHKEIVKVRDSGKAVLLVSLEIDEIFDLADTIYTIYEGHITGKFSPKETTFKEIGLYETGAKCQPEYLTPELEQEMTQAKEAQ